MAAAIKFKQMCPSCEALVPIRDPKLVGRKIGCPKCEYRFEVEAPEEETPKKGKGKKGKGKGAKPKAKKGGSNMVLIGGGLAVVALIGLVIGGFFMLSGDDSSSSSGGGGNPGGGGEYVGDPSGDGTGGGSGTSTSTTTPAPKLVKNLTNLLPNDTEAVFSVALGEVRKSSLNRAALDSPGSFRPKQFEKTFGFSVDKVEQVIVALNDTQNWVFTVLRTTEVLNEDDLVKRLSLFSEAPINGLNYFTVRREFDPLGNLLLKGNKPRKDFTLHILDPQTLVFADKQPMAKFLEAGTKPEYITQPPALPSTPAISEPDPCAYPGPGCCPDMPMDCCPSENGSCCPPEGSGCCPEGDPCCPMGMGTETQGTRPPPRPRNVPNWLTVKESLKKVLDRVQGRGPAMIVAVEKADSAFANIKNLLEAIGPLLPTETRKNIEKQQESVSALLLLGVKRLGFTLRELTEDKLVCEIALDTTEDRIARAVEIQLIKQGVARKRRRNPNQGYPGPNGSGYPGPGGDPCTEGYPCPSGGCPEGEGYPCPMGGQGYPCPSGGCPEGEGYPCPMGSGGTGRPKPKPGVEVSSFGKILVLHVNQPLAEKEYRQLMEGAQTVMVWLRGDAEMLSKEDRVHTLAEALAKYVEDHGQFPRGTADRPTDVDQLGEWLPDRRLSWMAELLPNLGEGYRDLPIDPSVSWDEGRNQHTAQVIVPYFLVQDDSPAPFRVNYPGQAGFYAATHFVGIAGLGWDSPEFAKDNATKAKQLGVFGYSRQTKLEDIKDGPEQTIALLQVPGDHNTPWLAGGGSTVRGVSEEDDAFLPFISTEYGEEKKEKGAYAIMADGKVRFIPASIKPETFRALCTIAGGEKIDDLDDLAPVIEKPAEVAPPPMNAGQGNPLPFAPPPIGGTPPTNPATGTNPTPKPQASNNPLEGTWICLKLELTGHPKAKEFNESTGYPELELRGSTFVMKDERGQIENEGTVRFDSTVSPKTIDINYSKGRNAGMKMLAVYSTSGDTCQIAFPKELGDPRPSQIPPEAPGSSLLTFRRK